MFRTHYSNCFLFEVHIGFHGHHLLFQDCLESTDQSEELETQLGKNCLGMDKDANVGTVNNVVIGLEPIIQIVFLVIHFGSNGHHILFQDCLEREELKTPPGKVDIWTDKDVYIGLEDNMVIDQFHFSNHFHCYHVSILTGMIVIFCFRIVQRVKMREKR